MPLPELPGGYVWDSSIRRYRASNGRIVSRRTIRNAIDEALSKMDGRARALSLELRNGAVSLTEWEIGMRQIIKDTHLFSAAAVRGGFDRMTQGDYGRVGQFIRTQYGYLDNFAAQLASGKQPMNGFFLSRAEMYAEQGRATHEAFVQSDARRTAMQVGGALEALNVLGDADHCTQCPAITRRGWIPDDQMPLPGTRICRSRCKCHLERRIRQSGDE